MKIITILLAKLKNFVYLCIELIINSMTCAFCNSYFDPSEGMCPNCKATVEMIVDEQYNIDEKESNEYLEDERV